MTDRIGVGVIGLGFMGRTHVRCYQSAAAAGLPCELLAVCDRSDSSLRGSGGGGNLATGADAAALDPSRVSFYRNPQALLNDPRIDLVSVCTYTETHVPIAVAALEAGKHVLVEKPVAITSADIRQLADVARGGGRLCMPGMCMRFWNGWDWLHDHIAAGTWGPVRSAQFQRLGAGPAWGAEFYRDYARSGGPLWDLHIHDADFLYWCFGRPASVCASGAADHFTTLYRFANGPVHASAEGGWDLQPSAGFRMRYLVTFERATVEFDLPRGVSVHTAQGSENAAFDDLTAYDRETRYFVDALVRGEHNLRATLEDAVAVAEILEAEHHSLISGRPIAL
jgi:predicted dehydrogenase